MKNVRGNPEVTGNALRTDLLSFLDCKVEFLWIEFGIIGTVGSIFFYPL